MQSCCHGRLR